jgi:phage antirepressor YoqD-like protein
MRGAGGGWNDKKVRKILSSGVGDDIVSTYKTHTLNETAKILSIPRLRVRDFLASRGLLKAKGVREWSM